MLSAEQQRAVLDAIPEEGRGVFLVMALLGLRPSEAMAVRANQLRGDGTLSVDRTRGDRHLHSEVAWTKTRRARTLPIPEELEAWIERWVPRERRLENGHLFVLPTTGGPWPESSLRRWWYSACEQAGVPRIGVYEGTKHTLGSG